MTIPGIRRSAKYLFMLFIVWPAFIYSPRGDQYLLLSR